MTLCCNRFPQLHSALKVDHTGVVQTRGWNARNVDDFNCDPLPVSSLRIFLIFHDPPNLAASFFFFLILSVSLFLEREVANSVASQRERLFSRFSIRDSSHFFGGFWRLTPSNLSFREF